jgi:hypothetical protein
VKPQKTLLAIMVGVYLLGFGMLVGTVLDRMRFDVQRTAVLTRYEQALSEWQTYRMAFEKDAASIRQEPQTSASRPGRVERAHPITLNLPQ